MAAKNAIGDLGVKSWARGANGLDKMWQELVRTVQRAVRVRSVQTLAECQIHQAAGAALLDPDGLLRAKSPRLLGLCPGFGAAPVKQIVWRHEEDELIGQKAQGKMDHITLAVKEGEVFGLSAEAFEKTARMDGGEVCFSAWIRLAQKSWLEAIAASAILEMRNSAELIQGGSLSRRIAAIFERDLGIPMKKQINNAEHVVMDVEHAHLLMQVAEHVRHHRFGAGSDPARRPGKLDDRSRLSRPFGRHVGKFGLTIHNRV